MYVFCRARTYVFLTFFCIHGIHLRAYVPKIDLNKLKIAQNERYLLNDQIYIQHIWATEV